VPTKENVPYTSNNKEHWLKMDYGLEKKSEQTIKWETMIWRVDATV